MSKITKIGSSNCYKCFIDGTPPPVSVSVQKDVTVTDENGVEYQTDIHKRVQEEYQIKDMLKIMIDKINELVDKVNE